MRKQKKSGKISFLMIFFPLGRLPRPWMIHMIRDRMIKQMLHSEQTCLLQTHRTKGHIQSPGGNFCDTILQPRCVPQLTYLPLKQLQVPPGSFQQSPSATGICRKCQVKQGLTECPLLDVEYLSGQKSKNAMKNIALEKTDGIIYLCREKWSC